jgi:excisionase family DNA binding protein
VNQKPALMTVGEVAAYLKVHPKTIYRLAKRKELPSFRIGREYRFRLSEIDEWITKRARASLKKR